MGIIVDLKDLVHGRYPQIICYPRFEYEELRRRIVELRSLNVEMLEFSGRSEVAGLPILGKGCVSLVLLAHLKCGRAALKVRRVDSGRESMNHEARMLHLANSVDVGPKIIDFTENFLLMQYINGFPLREWLEKSDPSADEVRMLLREILEKCWRLDAIGLDHGELSRASKHIIVDFSNRAQIIDFESSSTNRRVSNVTSICQYLFLRGEIADIIGKMNIKPGRKRLLAALKAYKRNPSRMMLEEIFRVCEVTV